MSTVQSERTSEFLSRKLVSIEKNSSAAWDERRDGQEHRQFEDLISDLSMALSKVPLPEVDHEIARALDWVVHFFEIDCCFLMEVYSGPRQIQMVNVSRGEESKQVARIMLMVNGIPWIYPRLVEQGQPMAFSSLEKLPAEANGERDFWENSGIQAMLMIPLNFRGKVTHLIGLTNSRSGQEWPENYPRRLRLLGEMIAKALIHRSDREALLRRERELEGSKRVAPVGIWEWNIASGKATWSDEVYRIFDLPPKEDGVAYETFLSCVHPQDRDLVRKAIEDSLSHPDRPCNIEHRLFRPDGCERVVQGYAEVLLGPDGNPAGMAGTIYDITERRRVEGELEKALKEIKRLREYLKYENIDVRREMKFQDRFPHIVGGSDPLRYVLYRIEQVAPTNTTVILTGETGTGKGLFARMLHEASLRRDKPFVNVNCAGLAPNLIESEIFGREKGAFTGSTDRQIGRFELANGGTIFLDEIGELPLDLQSKLLKVIESGEFERLGSPHTIKVDARIVACTNRNIEEEIQKGKFRRDLFYRLNVFPITIPPLRERREDIPLLVDYYVRKFGKGNESSPKKISKETMKTLQDYSWPGNVRELINVIERAVIMNESPQLRLSEKMNSIPFGRRSEVISKMPKAVGGNGIKSLSDVERAHILKTLLQTGWRVEGGNGAAQLLGINPSTLRARMKKLGINRPKHPMALPLFSRSNLIAP